jgi:hypothetical protein
LQICKKFPHTLSEPLEHADGGPLTGLLTELEFNHILHTILGCPFETYQFQRAVSDGILSLLDDTLRDKIMRIYANMKYVNYQLETLLKLPPSDFGAGLTTRYTATCCRY